MEFGTTYVILACIFGFLMAWGIGANDVANAMGTSVGSGAVTLRQAILIAMVFESFGAVLAGGGVTDTIRKNLINPAALAETPELLVHAMLAALLATAIWLALASHRGWPVSTTHTIVGSIVGLGAISLGLDAIQWPHIGKILLAWLLSPLIGGVLAFVLYMSVRIFILNTASPFDRAKKIVPLYIFLTTYIFTSITIMTGLGHIGIQISYSTGIAMTLAVSTVAAIIGALLLARVNEQNDNPHFHYESVERVFGVLMVFTGCAMAFAHGSNDVSNAVGPLAAVVSIVATNQVTQSAAMPSWILLLGAGGIVVGLLTYGHHVIATIGQGITQLTPTRGFAATLAAALTVALASAIGMPISTTHTLVGAILGVGLARGIDALNLSGIAKIFTSWLVTPPAGAFVSVILFQIFQWIF
ncbi:MAG: inorganic phosphate transporter [Pseudomonadota bacterium]